MLVKLCNKQGMQMPGKVRLALGPIVLTRYLTSVLAVVGLTSLLLSAEAVGGNSSERFAPPKRKEGWILLNRHLTLVQDFTIEPCEGHTSKTRRECFQGTLIIMSTTVDKVSYRDPKYLQQITGHGANSFADQGDRGRSE